MAMSNPSKSLLITATQLVVSFGLLGWLAQRFDFANALSLITAINPFFFGFCAVVSAVLVVPASIRWRWFIAKLLDCDKVPPSLAVSIRINSVNVALNQFLPSTIGGDLYRVLIARTLGMPVKTGMLATLGDRLSALLALLLVSGPALIAVLISNDNVVLIAFRSLAFAFLGGSAILYAYWRWIRHHSYLKGIQSFFDASFFALRTGGAIIHVLLTSLVIQLTTLCVMILIAKVVGVNVHFLLLAGIMAASLLASRLPISVAGWGVREGLLVSLFSTYGVPAELALATSIFFGFVELAAAMLAVIMAFFVALGSKFFAKQSPF